MDLGPIENAVKQCLQDRNKILIFANVNEIEAGRLLFFLVMDRKEFEKVLNAAAQECGCRVVDIDFNDDDNIFDVTIERADSQAVSLDECEHVHRAVLTAFDRDIEDYALTVGSCGIDAASADELLSTIKD